MYHPLYHTSCQERLLLHLQHLQVAGTPLAAQTSWLAMDAAVSSSDGGDNPGEQQPAGLFGRFFVSRWTLRVLACQLPRELELMHLDDHSTMHNAGRRAAPPTRCPRLLGADADADADAACLAVLLPPARLPAPQGAGAAKKGVKMKLGAKLQMYYNEEVGRPAAACSCLGSGCRLSVAAGISSPLPPAHCSLTPSTPPAT